MIAYCGLNCSKCEAYRATQNDDANQREAVAKKWSKRYRADIQPRHINCHGCRSGGSKFFYCKSLCQVRRCCIQKKVVNCAACEAFGCATLSDFLKLAPEASQALDKLRGSTHQGA